MKPVEHVCEEVSFHLLSGASVTPCAVENRLFRCLSRRLLAIFGTLLALLVFEAAGLATDIIVDNTDSAGVIVTGAWTPATSTYGYQGTNYVHDGNTAKGTKSVRFTPTIPTAGDYDVYLRWTAGGDRATNVPADVVDANGTTTFIVNQQLDGALWFRLGTAHFAAGTSGSVLVRTDSTNGFVVADAARFVTAGTPPNSLIETFTAVDTPRLLNGLGWNVTLGNEWEWDKVKLARGREVRVQFGWETVESASSGVLSLTTNFQNALSWCQKYGLQPLIVAAYGPPRALLTTLTVASDVPSGSTVIPVTSTAALPYTDVSNSSPIVVDNSDATGVTVTGSWTTVTSTNGWNGSYLSDGNAGKGTKTVRFTPTLPVAGQYDIYVRYPSSSGFANNVSVDVTTTSGTETITVSEQQQGGSWLWLKRAQCDAGTASNILIRNDGTTQQVNADAAAWVPTWGVDAPIHKCHVLKPDGSHIVPEGKWAYYGALIDAVDPIGGTITLAAKTNVALTAGTVLNVNQLRYASAATESGTDTGWGAYARYVKYLADQVAAYGLTGRIELWNEPGWLHDSWDHRGGFYDTAPIGATTTSPNPGMLHCVLDQTLPANVRYSWGGTHKSGTRSVLGTSLPKPTQAQVAATVPSEGWHPYGATPEHALWDPNILPVSSNIASASLEGSNVGSNFKNGRKTAYNNLQNLGWTVTEQISETGLYGSDQMNKARFDVRTFLAYMSVGPQPQLDRVNFYRLAEDADGFAMIDSTTQVELQPYIALKALMNDIAAIGVAPVSYTTADLPSAAAPYAGCFPLMTIPVVGRSATAETRNSTLFVCYQRTYADTDTAWRALAPAAVPVNINIPSGYVVQSAIDLVTRQPVTFNVASGVATFSVADNPIALKVIPDTGSQNVAPTPANDSPTTNESVAVTIDVLANDTDPDNGPQPLVLQSVAQPAHGTATIVNGKIFYTPSAGFYGQETFSYTVSDAALTASANVTVTVNSTATANDLTGFGLTGAAVGDGAGSSRVLGNGNWEMNGAGAGPAGAADATWFESQTQSGGFQVRVKLQSLTGGTDARAGVMLREGSAASARFVQLSATTAASARFNSRNPASTSATAEQIAPAQNQVAFPNKWLLLERLGNEVAIRVDDNNSGYAEIGRIALSGLNASLQIGLFTSSGDSGPPARAVFSNFEITPLATWTGGAGTQNWNDANNWSPATVPVYNTGVFNVAIPNGSAFVVKVNANDVTSSGAEDTGLRIGSITVGTDATILRNTIQDFFTGRNILSGTQRSYGVVNNRGTLRNDTASSTWLYRWSPVAHVNAGTIEARNSAATVKFDFGTATLDNTAGTIKATSGGIVLFGGSLVVTSGTLSSDSASQLQCIGDNRNADFTNGQLTNAGTWLHQQASATTSTRTNLSQFNGSTVFDNTGTFKIRQAMTSTDANTQTAVLELHNTAHFNNAAGGSVIISNECTSSNVAITGQRIARLDIPDATAVFTNLGTVTITDALATAGLNTRSELRSAAPFTNQGQINVTGARSFLTMTGTEPYRQTAGSTVLSGATITAASTSIDGGTLKGSGVVSGNLAFGSAGAFEAQLQNNGTSNLIAITGQVQLGGSLQVTLPNGYNPAGGTEFRIMAATGGFAGAFQSVPITWRVVVRGTDLFLQRDSPPTIAQAAAASANPVTGASVNLSALGQDDGGEANLLYTWQLTGSPPAPVTFSANGTNASKTTVAAFTNPGNYTFQLAVQDQSGLVATGSVTVAVQQNVSLWSNAHFTPAEVNQPAISGALADPDFDGVCNLLEYAMGLNPRAQDAAGNMPIADTQTGFLRLTFTRPRPAPPDLIYEVEVKANLASGLWQAVSFDGLPVDNGNGTETLRARDTVPTNGTLPRFIHLRVRVTP